MPDTETRLFSEPFQNQEPLTPELTRANLDILNDWLGNKLGIILTYIEIGDDVSEIIEHLETKDAIEAVLEEKKDGKNYGDILPIGIDARIYAAVDSISQTLREKQRNGVSTEELTAWIEETIEKYRKCSTLEEVDAQTPELGSQPLQIAA